MSGASSLVNRSRTRFRRKRLEVFRRTFAIGPETRILDVGSEDGSHISSVVRGTDIEPRNVYIADIDESALSRGRERFGFTPVPVGESSIEYGFPDRFFDIVFCSSAIEHVTVPKSEVWTLRSEGEFRRRSLVRQRGLAKEIRRLGRGYFVQTPNRYFPIETHTWLPCVGWMPRSLLVPFLQFSNRVWIKKTAPDWHLLTTGDMEELFPDAEILVEGFLGLAKSIIAVRRE